MYLFVAMHVWLHLSKSGYTACEDRCSTRELGAIFRQKHLIPVRFSGPVAATFWSLGPRAHSHSRSEAFGTFQGPQISYAREGVHEHPRKAP